MTKEKRKTPKVSVTQRVVVPVKRASSVKRAFSVTSLNFLI
jgi:hypothetical protein